MAPAAPDPTDPTPVPADPPADPWRAWAAARVPMAGVYLASAAAGRSSRATIAAVVDHLEREAAEGAYGAAEAAGPVVERLRGDLAGLVGVDAAGVALTESARTGLAALLALWPFAPGAAVAVAPSEWGMNLAAFAQRGLDVVVLAVDDDGVIDLDRLDRLVRTTPPAVVHVGPQASHRALRQPLAEIVAVCAAADVPVWVDAAQTLGHAPIAPGAAALYATSRKWLTGPRGVGLLAVAEPWRAGLRVDQVAPHGPADAPLVAAVEQREAHVAGRLGLAAAVAELLAVGLDRVSARLDEVGATVRRAVAEVDRGWRVVGPVDAPGAITALAPTRGQGVAATQARLLRDGIVTTVATVDRAPLELSAPVLRLSPHVDLTPAHVEALLAALPPP